MALEEMMFALVAAIITQGLNWLRGNQMKQMGRVDKIAGIARAAIPYIEDAARLSPWKWDDSIVAWVNKSLAGQGVPVLTAKEKQLVRDMFPAPPVPPLPSDGTKIISMEDIARLRPPEGG